MIVASNVTFYYPQKRALSRASCTVNSGKITALVGPNGSGKTTLMRCIAALDTPYSGTISVNGIDTQSAPRDVHRMVGYLSDSFGLYDDLSVTQCLLHAAEMRGIRGTEATARTSRVVEQLNLQSLRSIRAGSLSRGQRQKVGMAQAMIAEPKVLLLDEPAAGLDPEARHDLSKLLLQFKADGTSILISSHILAELEDYSDAMLTIKDGKVLAQVDISATTSTTQAIHIECSAANEEVHTIVTSIEGVLSVRRGDSGFLIEIPTNDEIQRSVLRALALTEIGLLSFKRSDRSMESIYLEQVRGIK